MMDRYDILQKKAVGVDSGAFRSRLKIVFDELKYDHGLIRPEIGELVGRSHSTLTNWASGARSMMKGLEPVARLAQISDVSLGWLLGDNRILSREVNPMTTMSDEAIEAGRIMDALPVLMRKHLLSVLRDQSDILHRSLAQRGNSLTFLALLLDSYGGDDERVRAVLRKKGINIGSTEVSELLPESFRNIG